MPARKTSQIPTRIYSYGAFAPTVNRERVEEQLRLANKYKNTLIEIELWRRNKVKEAQMLATGVAEADERVAAVDAEREQVLLEYKAARKATRGRKGVTLDREKLTAIKARLKEARAAFKEAKIQAREDPRVVEALKVADEEAATKVYAARAACGLYWCTYSLVESDVQAAKKSKTPPHYHRWDGSGRVGVQIHKKHMLIGDQVFGSDRRLQINPVDPAAWIPKKINEYTKGERRQLMRTEVRMRIGSDEHKDPVFAAFPICFHRPLPADANIKCAWLRRTIHGLKECWEFQIVIESRTFLPPVRKDRGVVAIDIGWRKRESDSLRFAYWADKEGKHGEICLPESIRYRLKHADTLRSIRDKNFNEAKSTLQAWLKLNEVQPWLQDATKFIAAWKSPKRLVVLLRNWQTFSGEDKILPTLQAWLKQDRHLYRWETEDRDRSLAYRKDFYRKTAARLTRNYATIVLEDFDLRTMASKEPGAPAADAPQTQRRNRTIAALSEFRETILSAAEKNGCAQNKRPSFNTTLKCYLCGALYQWDPAPQIEHTCIACNGTLDQDYNAALNLLSDFEKTQDSPLYTEKPVQQIKHVVAA